MVDTAAPPDYCDNDVGFIVQQAPSGVNSLEQIPTGREEELVSTFKVLGYYRVMRD
jgi:hypothetical protein